MFVIDAEGRLMTMELPEENRVQRSGLKFICHVPPDSQLMTFGDEIILVSPGFTPRIITAAGTQSVVALPRHPGAEKA
jgi:hypothetical protein